MVFTVLIKQYIIHMPENFILTTRANIEDQDEMLHKTAFHQGLHCLLSLIFRERNIIFFWKL